MGLSGQDPGFILNGINPNPSRHEPLFREHQRPGHPQRRPKDWAAAIFPHLSYLPRWALTLGSHHGLSEGQGPTPAMAAQGSSLKAEVAEEPSGEEGRIPPGPYVSLSSPHG